jgi:hypothetical protein
VLKARVRGVLARSGEREVVVEVARAEVRGRLRDDLRALHRLPVPERSAVLRACVSTRVTHAHPSGAHNGGAETLCLARVRRVLERGRDTEVLGRRARAVDVPLVRRDLIRPRPLVERRGREGGIQQAGPDDGAGARGRDEEGERSERGLDHGGRDGGRAEWAASCGGLARTGRAQGFLYDQATAETYWGPFSDGGRARSGDERKYGPTFAPEKHRPPRRNTCAGGSVRRGHSSSRA